MSIDNCENVSGVWRRPGGDREALDLAERVLVSVPGAHEALAGLVVGSVARGWSSARSDVDLLLIYGEQTAECAEVEFALEGRAISVMKTPLATLRSVLRAGPANLSSLRTASNIADGIEVFDRAGVLPALKAANESMFLARGIERFYLADANRSLQQARTCSTSSTMRRWTARAAQDLLLVLLARTHWRVIKAKWSWRCLEDAYDGLSEHFMRALALDECSRWIEAGFLRSVVDRLQESEFEQNDLLKTMKHTVDDAEEFEVRGGGFVRATAYLKECVALMVLRQEGAGEAEARRNDGITARLGAGLPGREELLVRAYALQRAVRRVLAGGPEPSSDSRGEKA